MKDGIDLELSISPVPGYRLAGEAPRWSDPYPSIQVSQDASWKDVVNWAVEHHQPKQPLAAGLRERIESIKQRAKPPEERIVQALEFVQDEIRYLGIEIGEGSYVPTQVNYGRGFIIRPERPPLIVRSS